MKKFVKFITLALVAVMLLGAIASNAAAYSSYTYSIQGKALSSPDGFSPDAQITSLYMGLTSVNEKGETTGTALDSPTQVRTDKQGRVYIADPVNNRIVVLNKFYKYLFAITSFVNSNGVSDSLSAPEGSFVTGDNEIYIADTGNKRIVVFNYEGKYQRHYDAPSSDVFDEDSIYKPISVAVDSAGRMYIVSATTYEGIISLDRDGKFNAFIGASKAHYNALQMIWRKFQTQEQINQMDQNISTEYNNITIDADGFIYVTTNALEESDQSGAIKSKGGDYQPVKKLNASGTDVMRRNGFFAPSGEVDFSNFHTTTFGDAPTGPSSVVDVALGGEETWSILDQKRSHIFTYDKNGNLLFAFGDTGTQLGNITLGRAVSLAYHGDDLLVLDGSAATITVYKRTEYGKILLQALQHTNAREYDRAVEDWQNILQRNNNFDTAYVGIGDSLYRQGKWKEAMEQYKIAYDVDDYSDAFKMYRKDIVSKNIIWILLGVVALIVVIAEALKAVGRLNKKTTLKRGKKTFWEEVAYGFHVALHPFDGFWDLKHERRGSVRGALFWLILVILAFTYQAVGQGYIFNSTATMTSVFTQITAIVVPLLLWSAANWCLTTLFDGEGSFKDIFIATCYATVPMTPLIVFATILTNFVCKSEMTFVSLIIGIAWVWFGLLLFFGMMITHDYSLGKNILISISTILGMAVIMFIAILFSGLLIKMVSFVMNIITEISFRV